MGATKSKETPNNKQHNQRLVDLSAIDARIDRVSISGIQRTKDDYIQRAVKNCFNVTTFKELLYEVGQSKKNLNELGIFKQLDVTVDISRGGKASTNGYDVLFRGKELTRITGNVGTEIGRMRVHLWLSWQLQIFLGVVNGLLCTQVTVIVRRLILM